MDARTLFYEHVKAAIECYVLKVGRETKHLRPSKN
jgi:hypothetical protein